MAESNMKVLLQDTQTKNYYCLLDLWTANVRVAFNFRHSTTALEFAHRNDLTGVRVVVHFDDAQMEQATAGPVPVGAVGAN